MVQCSPFYGSGGLFTAQQLLLDYLPTSFEDRFYAKDIKSLPGYVDVPSFGDLYANYESIEKRNIMAIIDSGKPGKTVILNGHIDVDMVQETPKLPHGTIADGRLYGRGSTDMLGGLTALALAAKCFSCSEGWSGKLILTAVTDEEIGGNGTLRALDFMKKKGLITPDTTCLIAEPTDNTRSLSSMGFMHLKLRFVRQPMHMGVALRKNNAIWDLNHFLNRVEHLFPEPFICSFGIVKGGEDAAIPLGKIELEGTLFFPDTIDPDFVTQKLLQEHTEITIGDFLFEGATFAENGLLEGMAPTKPFPSPCDARLFKRYGISTVICGPGNLKEAHSKNESLSLTEWKSYCDRLIRHLYEYMQ
ncbi:MAG: Succinyl-diaminopimelate desuccinylase [Chlamydiales bacterium]|nr:Succinyl-diaminopimelate desuccinylase [Chlamydiales bacterium]